MNTQKSPVTFAALGLCFGFYILQSMGGGQEVLLRWLALWPSLSLGGARLPPGAPEFAPWQLLTYALLHGGTLHLLFNALGLFLFGRAVEWAIGSPRMLFYLLLCIVGAGLTQLGALGLEGRYNPTIGISGGVMGLLPAFALLYPRARIMLLFPPIPLPAPVFVLLYALLELWLGSSGMRTGIAHFAHLGGMFVGGIVLVVWYLHGDLRPRPLAPPPDQH